MAFKRVTELVPGDLVIVEPSKGRRADEVILATATRYASFAGAGAALGVEVVYRRHGTYHYKRSESVEISDTNFSSNNP
jgi:hypothetical protein